MSNTIDLKIEVKDKDGKIMYVENRKAVKGEPMPLQLPFSKIFETQRRWKKNEE